MGNGTFGSTVSYTPTDVVGGHKFTSVSAGYHHCLGIDDTGKLWAWGYNGYGQLGTGTTSNYSVPTAVLGEHVFVSVHAGESYSLGLDIDGKAWAWGYNYYGQLGIGITGGNVLEPTAVLGDHVFTNIVIGYNHSIGLDTNGKLWSWGQNNSGELGTNNNVWHNSPTEVYGNHKFCYISAGWNFSHAIDENGITWAWGTQTYGILGNATTTGSSLIPVVVYGNHNFVKIFSNYFHTVAIDADGDSWSWGYNPTCELGYCGGESQSIPQKIDRGIEFSSFTCGYSHTLGIDVNGIVYGFGTMGNGQLLIASLSNVSSVSAGWYWSIGIIKP